MTIINFWQALGLFLLSRILFGGFPGKPGWARHGHRNRREMEEMRQNGLICHRKKNMNFQTGIEKPVSGAKIRRRSAPEGSVTE